MIKLLLICIFFTFPYQFQASQPSIKNKSITPDTHLSFSTKTHQPSTKTTSITHDTRMSFPTRKSAHGSKSSDSGKKHSDIVYQLINKPTPPNVKDKTPPSMPAEPSYPSDSENNRSNNDRDDVFHDDETEFIPSTPFASAVECTTIGAAVIVYSIAAAGLVLTAPLAIGAGFVALGVGFFMQDAQEKSVGKIAQEKLIVVVALENAKEDKQAIIIEKAPKKEDAYVAKCKEIKKFFADYVNKNNKKSPINHSYDAQQKEMQEWITVFTLATKIQEFLTATSAHEKAEIIQKIVDILNQLQNDPELLFAESLSAHNKKAEQGDSFVQAMKEDTENLVSFFENIDCQDFLQNNDKVAGRILATSAVAPVLIFSGEAFAVLGPLAPLGAAIIAGGLFLENREAIFNLIDDLKKGNYFKTQQEKLALEELKKYFQDLDIAFDSVINIGYRLDINVDNILMKSLQYGYRDDKSAQVLTIVDKHGKQTVFLISSGSKIPVRQLTVDDGISRFLFSQKDIDEKKAAIAMQQQLEINAKNAEKQAAIDKVLAQAEKKQPSAAQYSKLPCYDDLLPTQGSGRLFQAAYSSDGTMLRNKSAGYYDTQGNTWTFNKEKQQWVVTNSFNSNKFIVNVQDQNPPSCPTIDTTPDPINNHQSNPPVDPVNPITPSNNISMDGGLVIPPVTTGCGGKGDHPDVPTILITPMPEPDKPTILITPMPEQQDQSLPGCGKPLPIDDPINSPLPGCGGKIDVMPEGLILKASPEGDLSGVEVEFREDNRKHIFDDRPGHLIDTAENRERIKKLVKDPTKYLGPDKHDNWWYGEILPDGTQLWGEVRGDRIINCGINEVPQEYNPDSGLCDFDPSKQKKDK